MVLALVFGRLIFMLLLKIIHAASGSVFKINSIAYLITLGLFFCVFLITSILNSRKVRLASPVQLLSSEKRGEKESAFRLPLAIIGLIALIVAYYFAWTIDNSGVALGVFFLLAILVIIATNLLFTRAAYWRLSVLSQ